MSAELSAEMNAEVPTLELDWRGPVRPAREAVDEALLDDLGVPGVYACLYDHGHLVRVYVGVTGNFATRLREHVAATLALAYDLHGEDGGPAYRVGDRAAPFRALLDLEAHQALAAATLRRMSWFLAAEGRELASGETPHWPAVEGLLIQHLRGLVAAGAADADGRRLAIANDRGGLVPDARIDVVNRGAAEVAAVFGERFSWPAAGAAGAAA